MTNLKSNQFREKGVQHSPQVSFLSTPPQEPRKQLQLPYPRDTHAFRTFTETIRHSLLLGPHLTFSPEGPAVRLLFLTAVQTTVKFKLSNKYSQYWATLIAKLSSLRF